MEKFLVSFSSKNSDPTKSAVLRVDSRNILNLVASVLSCSEVNEIVITKD